MQARDLPHGLAALAIEGLYDAIVVLDGAGSITYANPAVELVTGIPPADIIGTPAFRFTHPEDLPGVQRAFAALFSEEKIGPLFEFRTRGANETWVSVESTAAVVTQDGQPFVVVSMRPLRSRGAIEEQARYEARFLRSLLREVQVGIVACDASGHVVAFNNELRGHHPLPDGRLEIDDWIRKAEFFEADGATPMSAEQAPIYRAFRGEHVRDLEYGIRTADGSIRLRRANGHPLVDDDGAFIGAFVALQDVTSQRQAEEALRRQALYDGLTGLPNRTLLLDRLHAAIQRCASRGSPLAVFFLDLDNFKFVNDSLGHPAGDNLLVQVSQRLTAAVTPGDTIARLGGDEFVVVSESITEEGDLLHEAQRIIETVSAPVTLGGTEVRVTASLGVAVSHGLTDDPERLLRDADTAMYLAKDRGRNRWEIFDRSLREAVVHRMEAEQSLRSAVEEGRLHVRFQPIVSAAGHAIVGFEALARYTSLDGREVQPADFIEVAEETGVISRIDLFVLEEAARFASSLPLVPSGQRPYVSCNFSAATLVREDLAAIVAACLSRYNLEPARLRLELTETALLAATAHTRDVFVHLLNMGIHVGIDDFGTGYSSLSYLRDLATSFVKIDGSFVQGLLLSTSNAAIVRAIVRLARALGKDVIAEGVESVEQAFILESFGCGALQGFHFAPPLSPADAAALLAQFSWPVAA